MVSHKIAALSQLLTRSGARVGMAALLCLQHALAYPSPHNTLYLELWCPTVAPSIVVTSDQGKTTFNFGDIAVGES